MQMSVIRKICADKGHILRMFPHLQGGKDMTIVSNGIVITSHHTTGITTAIVETFRLQEVSKLSLVSDHTVGIEFRCDVFLMGV